MLLGDLSFLASLSPADGTTTLFLYVFFSGNKDVDPAYRDPARYNKNGV